MYKKCGIKKFPIDCEYILSSFGYRVRTYRDILAQSPEAAALSKQFSEDSFADKINNLVLYNHKVNTGRARFSKMHELGHIVLNHIGKCQTYEDEADNFASNILAPRPIIYYKELKTCDEIHDYFGISYSAANNVITDMKHWEPNPATYNPMVHHFTANPEKDELESFIEMLELFNPRLLFKGATYSF